MGRKSLEERIRDAEERRAKAEARAKVHGATKQKLRRRLVLHEDGDSCTVYFVRFGEAGPIKIGRTDGDPMNRLAALQTAVPEELSLVATMPGVLPSTEMALHFRFKHLRLRGEWFKPEPDLMDYIRDYAKPWTTEQPDSSGDKDVEDSRPILPAEVEELRRRYKWDSVPVAARESIANILRMEWDLPPDAPIREAQLIVAHAVFRGAGL
jgi:hypothetical protein